MGKDHVSGSSQLRSAYGPRDHFHLQEAPLQQKQDMGGLPAGSACTFFSNVKKASGFLFFFFGLTMEYVGF